MKSRNLGKPAFQLLEDFPVALGLGRWNEGMQSPYGLPGHRQHLGGGIQLHRAGTERDHRGGQRKILRLETSEIAEHLGLGMICVKDRMSEEGARATQRIGRLPGEWIRFGGTASLAEKLNQ